MPDSTKVDILTSLIDTRKQNEELALLEIENKKTRLDSIEQGLLNADGSAKAFNKKIDDKSHIIEGPPIYGGDPELYKQKVLDLVEDIVLYESNTNIGDEFSEYQNLRSEFYELHNNYGYTDYSRGTTYKGQTENFTLNVDLSSLDNNKFDKIWAYAMTPMSESHTRSEDEPIILLGDERSTIDADNVDRSFDILTKSRIVAGSEAIHDLIYGKTQEGLKKPGFYDSLETLELRGEGWLSHNIKDALNWTTNKSLILQEALQWKHNGKDWFFHEFRPGKSDLDERTPDSIYNTDALLAFNRGLSKLPKSFQEEIKTNLQQYVDDIYTRGIMIYENDTSVERYRELEKQFPEYNKTPRREGDIAFEKDMNINYKTGNKKLETLKAKKRNLEASLDIYKFSIGEKFDMNQALNSISVNHLGKELNKLKDEERTENFDQLLEILSNDIQSGVNEVEIAYKNYLEQTYADGTKDTLSFADFKNMYELDPNRYR